MNEANIIKSIQERWVSYLPATPLYTERLAADLFSPYAVIKVSGKPVEYITSDVYIADYDIDLSIYNYESTGDAGTAGNNAGLLLDFIKNLTYISGYIASSSPGQHGIYLEKDSEYGRDVRIWKENYYLKIVENKNG